ncbi:Lipoprotein releasing system transmembrane protein LolC/LolE [hydrothermal vent metagenome]|uniref:Lipoprotein releasing system transmembrane protein LolC/LolE n=1 Tax=hydrothermal vent metagenome TaxID=652676 RepID=A0A3B0Y1F9_9ZZZZ
MFKSLSLSIGLRYVRAKRRNHFISFISVISMVGIMLGVAVLIIVLSVMNGFETEISKRLLGMESHITLRGFKKDWKEVMHDAKKYPQVTGAAPIVQGQGLASQGRMSQGVIIRGIDPDYQSQVSDIGNHLTYGSMAALKRNRWGVILGYEVAKKLLSSYEVSRLLDGSSYFKIGIKPECRKKSKQEQKLPKCIIDNRHKVMLVVPSWKVTAGGVRPTYRRFTVVGIFKIDMKQYDTTMVLLNIDGARRLLNVRSKVSAIQLRLKNVFNTQAIIDAKYQFLDDRLSSYVYTWMENNKNLFSAIATEKRMMFFVLLLIVIVAAINIVSTLVMVVTDKQADIAILRTLGATPGMIRKIFIVQGTVIGTVGATLGVLLGLLVSANVESIISGIEYLKGESVLDPSVYYISKLVAEVRWTEVVTIYTSSLLVGLIATLYPAYAASNTQPAEALRYE